MSLSVGTHLGPYEILSPLGAGGMGEVHRARGQFDAAAGGQRFVIPYEAGQPSAAITLVVNWDAELKKK